MFAMPTAEHYQQYELLRREDGSLWELGRGAMGVTYKAYDTNLRITVALKVINSTYLDSDTARQRFLREARAAAALRHPNVASVFNLGTDQGNYFYVMEFIDGETVDARVKREGRLEPTEALNIVLQVARALGVAAKQQLVHRDLKPSNLMLVDEEGESTVKVIDFGLAKGAKGAVEDSGTLTIGGFVGTPHFASPEQVEEGDLDVRSDIYSLGATLYFMLAGKAPFSGSIGQVMSQHLYKPIAVEPLTDVPGCVVSLIQSMLEKDRDLRPQTPRDLQDAIVSCLEQIRASSTRGIRRAGEEPQEPLVPGALLAQNYRLIEELRDTPQGRHFIAEDLRHNRRVSLLILSREFVADPNCFKALEAGVKRLRNAPHSMLREIYSLETAGGYDFLAEEYVVGPSLVDLLRSRNVLSGAEVVRLLSLLAPLADHATAHGLEHVDLTLLGIHLINRESTGREMQAELLRRPLTAWEHLELKVNAIDFSSSSSHAGTWAGLATQAPGLATRAPGLATQLQSAAGRGPRDSCVRLLSLLAYELLGGPRSRVEATGRYTPIATLTQEGNAALRRGLIDDLSSAAELARELAAAVGVKGPAAPVPESTARVAPEPIPAPPPPSAPSEVRIKGKPVVSARRWVLAIASIALVVAGGFLVSWFLQPKSPGEIVALSIQSEPTGASFLLDGKPPQEPPNTFTRVPFGTHQLTAMLDNYEPLKQAIEVRDGMAPEIRLQLKPRPPREIAELSVQSEPPGASILLDGKPPQTSPGTFTRVPFGTHQLTATLDNYELLKQDIEIREGMAPEIRLQLKPRPPREIAELSVQSEPPGATILLDGKPPQTPPGTFTRVPFGTHQLTATLDNYELLKQDIEIREGMTPKVSLKLKPKPPRELAALSIRSEPPGASILLDGKPPQTPPGTFTHVPFGPHQLTATLDNYESFKQAIEVREGMTPEIRLELKPREIVALSIRSEPAGASILLDGKPPQTPPGTFTHVPFGTHQLSAALDNYEPLRQDIEVREGMTTEIRLKLKPIPPRAIARISVQSEPPGASLFLDGKPPQKPPGTFTDVPFGTHQLSATLDDYEPLKQGIEVREGMTPEIRLKLKPMPPREIAALSIRSDPPGASILLDGKPPQTPPNTFTRVPFGTHQVTATLDNYEPLKQDLEVREGMTPEFRLKLKPMPPREIAALSIQSEPPGASILLDGKPPQTPPGTFTHVPFGTHQLTATLDKYEPLQQDIEVREGINPEIRLELKPKPDPLEDLLAEVKRYDENSPHYLTAYVRLAQFAASSGASKSGDYINELGRIIERLRTQAPLINKDDFNLFYKDNIKDAAKLNILPAILLLADNEKGNEAFDLFSRAATLGDSYAMMRLGRLYLRKGTPNDDDEGFKWLNRAYNAPSRNLEAGAYIADCYLSGKGTKQSVPKAEEIILPLANQEVVPAMTLAGRILQYKAAAKRTEAERNTNPGRKDDLTRQADELDRQAREWWERAAAKGDLNASARLGLCYQEGWGGVAKDEGEAEKRYKEGANHGNALSMFFYGLLIEKQPGRRSEAETLIKQAAAAGLPSARKWCKENKVDFADVVPDDERQ